MLPAAGVPVAAAGGGGAGEERLSRREVPRAEGGEATCLRQRARHAAARGAK